MEQVFQICADQGDVANVRKALEHRPDLCVSRGIPVLHSAAELGHVGVMEVLSEYGVKDTVVALFKSVRSRQWESARFLVKQYDRDSLDHVKQLDVGVNLLFLVMCKHKSYFAPKFVRWLMDAGVELRQRVSVPVRSEQRPFLAQDFVDFHMGNREASDIPYLYAIGKLLKQEEAVHAKSWLWPLVLWLWAGRKKKSLSLSLNPVRSSRYSRVALRGLFRYTEKTY